MNGLDPIEKDSDKIVHEAKQKKEYKFIGSIKKPHAGMILFKCNVDTHEISEVEIQRKAYLDTNGRSVIKSRAMYVDKHIYMWAINQKNAKKKYLKYNKKSSRQPANQELSGKN